MDILATISMRRWDIFSPVREVFAGTTNTTFRSKTSAEKNPAKGMRIEEEVENPKRGQNITDNRSVKGRWTPREENEGEKMVVVP